MADVPTILAHTLVPLNLAAEHVMRAVYADRSPITDKAQLLDSIASTLSVLADIYQYKTESRIPARRLSRMEMEGGMFKGGAKELRFIDGRATRTSLAVAAEDIAAAIKALKSAV
jgi:hypothetical protein